MNYKTNVELVLPLNEREIFKQNAIESMKADAEVRDRKKDKSDLLKRMK